MGDPDAFIRLVPLSMRGADELDRKILHLLGENGRLPNLEIARRVGVSEKTIRVRIARLSQNGMRVVARLDDGGRPTRMLFFVHTHPGCRFDVASRFVAMDQVQRVVLTTGAYDLVVEAGFATDADALSFLVREVEGGVGIRATDSSHLIKEVTALDAPFAAGFDGKSGEDTLGAFVLSAARASSVEDLLERAADAALAGNRADRILISTFDHPRDEQELHVRCRSARRLSDPYVNAIVDRVNSGIAKGVVMRVLATKLHVFVEDAPTDPLLSGLGDVIRQEGYRSLLSLPIFDGSDILGTLNLYFDQIHHLGDEEISRAQAYADQIGLAAKRLSPDRQEPLASEAIQ